MLEIEFLQTRDVGAQLGVGPDQVRRLASSGRLPCTRTAGGYRMYAATDVARLAANRDAQRAYKVPAAPAAESDR